MKYLRTANTLLRRSAVPSAVPSASLSRTALSLTQTSNPSQPAARSWNLPRNTVRPFSHTTSCEKKKGGKDNNNSKGASKKQASTSNNSSDDAASTSDAGAEDPFDLNDVTQGFERAEKRYLEDLKKLRTGGRFNADVIGAIPVQVDKKSTQTFPLRELATVAPLGGRRWSILAFEEASVKSIISAVQRSEEFNQQPQRSEDNPLELTMMVEPERAETLAKRVKEVCQAWRTKVRDEAHRRTEANKKWKADGTILDDDFRKLKDKLQKLQDAQMKVIMAKEKEVVQQVMSRAG